MDLNAFFNIIHDKSKGDSEKFIAFNAFFDYYSDLVAVVLGKTTYSDKQLSEHIFLMRYKKKLNETVFKKHLYASYKTLERIKKEIIATDISKYIDFLVHFSFDVYTIIAYAENNYKGNTLKYDMGSRPDLSVQEIYDNACIVLHIKRLGADFIHYRDFFPLSVFAVRLTIEVCGKNILGYYSITDAKGNRPRSLNTQIAWDYIKFDQLNGKRIQLPVDVDVVLEIEKWTNRYIHTGYIQPIYLVETALYLLEPFVYPPNKKTDYEGRAKFAGTSYVTKYNEMKLEFEEYIHKGINYTWLQKIKNIFRCKKAQKYIVNWKAEKSVDVTILSL